jgi:predicted  nucleic acid-binding Zn-ribbon protein
MEAEVRRELDEIRAILRAVAERQAASEKRMDRAEARMDRAEERMDRFDARVRESDARFEKRMKGFENLARLGMKEIEKLGRSQQRTEATLRAFMDSLRRGNGHNGGRTR